MAAVREHYWIPQLRRQVRTVIKRCIPCQRMNNSPYKYPDMADLPNRRVVRSRPFAHVGLDYFGPLTIASGKSNSSKVYGCILTCTTTRLIHLELVTDMTTQSFINALRRFIARRGVPSTITSDNAHTFTLGDQILANLTKHFDREPEVDRLMSKHGITWHYNIPYSPWQGGFYERLIKIVKHSLYKTLGKKVVNLDNLSTLLTETEACLNTRPLTYQEESWESQPILRPIDFIQKDITLTFPFEEIRKTTSEYLTAADMLLLKTRKEAEEALRDSHSRTEKFWEIWQSQYLKNLREHHQQNLRGKREGTDVPRVDDVDCQTVPINERGNTSSRSGTAEQNTHSKTDQFTNSPGNHRTTQSRVEIR
uniref:Integrase catalytic domain-containing protein n=1 Tax=Heterorhabditis bacteriophora TaxID=37862 RepID=A0A1I7X086_HETBA